MFNEYFYLKELTKLQKKFVNDFNKNSKLQFQKIDNCEICKSKNIKLLFTNDRYGINQKTCFCDDCGFMFSNPRMTEHSTQFFYNSDIYRYIYAGEQNEEILFQNTLKELKNYKPKYPKKPDFEKYYEQLYFDFINNEVSDFESVLDIGCGRGKKIIDFNYIGKTTRGIEPSKTFHKVHTSLGLNCNVGFIKDIKEKYDLVILSHVFEHLTNLHEVVDILSNITKKYLFIEVPGHVTKFASIQNAHNYYFSFNTLNHFILNNKFTLIKSDYIRNNEFILSLYKKTEKKSKYVFDKGLEKKMFKKMSKKYFGVYFTKYVITKFLRIIGLEKIFKKIFNLVKDKYKNLHE